MNVSPYSRNCTNAAKAGNPCSPLVGDGCQVTWSRETVREQRCSVEPDLYYCRRLIMWVIIKKDWPDIWRAYNSDDWPLYAGAPTREGLLKLLAERYYGTRIEVLSG